MHEHLWLLVQHLSVALRRYYESICRLVKTHPSYYTLYKCRNYSERIGLVCEICSIGRCFYFSNCIKNTCCLVALDVGTRHNSGKMIRLLKEIRKMISIYIIIIFKYVFKITFIFNNRINSNTIAPLNLYLSNYIVSIKNKFIFIEFKNF